MKKREVTNQLELAIKNFSFPNSTLKTIQRVGVTTIELRDYNNNIFHIRIHEKPTLGNDAQ